MNQKNVFFFVYAYILYILLQVLFLRYVNFGGLAFCFAYIGYLLAFPLDFSRLLHLIIAFLVGISVDIFYDSPGIHAGACILMVYFRKRIIGVLAPTGGYEAGNQPSVLDLGSNWFLIYVSLSAFFHHAFVFFVSASNFKIVGNTLLKTILSVVFTTAVLYFFQRTSLSYNKYKSRRRR